MPAQVCIPVSPFQSTACATPGRLRQLWMNENPRFKGQLRATTGAIGSGRDTIRFRTRPIGCKYLCHSHRLRIANGLGPCHPSDGLSEIAKFLNSSSCPPSDIRQQGIGSCLEGMCQQDALSVESEQIELLLHEVDAIVGGPLRSRQHARNFGNVRGYSWRWSSSPRRESEIVAVGLKAVVKQRFVACRILRKQIRADTCRGDPLSHPDAVSHRELGHRRSQTIRRQCVACYRAMVSTAPCQRRVR